MLSDGSTWSGTKRRSGSPSARASKVARSGDSATPAETTIAITIAPTPAHNITPNLPPYWTNCKDISRKVRIAADHFAAHQSKPDFRAWLDRQPGSAYGCLLIKKRIARSLTNTLRGYGAKLRFERNDDHTWRLFMVGVRTTQHGIFVGNSFYWMTHHLHNHPGLRSVALTNSRTSLDELQVTEVDVMVRAKWCGPDGLDRILYIEEFEFVHRSPKDLAHHCLECFGSPHLRMFVGVKHYDRQLDNTWAGFYFVVTRDPVPGSPLVLRQFVSCGTAELAAGTAVDLMEGLLTPLAVRPLPSLPIVLGQVDHGPGVDHVMLIPDATPAHTQPVRCKLVETPGPSPAVEAGFSPASILRYRAAGAVLSWCLPDAGLAAGAVSAPDLAALPLGGIPDQDRAKYVVCEPQQLSLNPPGAAAAQAQVPYVYNIRRSWNELITNCPYLV